MSPVASPLPFSYRSQHSERVREGMRRAAASRLAEIVSPADPKPAERPDDGAHLAQAYAHEWTDAIRFHAGRGMSRASLCSIYGRDAVNAVLGGGI